MKTSIPALLASAALALAPVQARSGDDTVAAKPQSPATPGQDRVAPSPPPSGPPQAPPAEIPPPPEQPGKANQAPPGQWVYTPEYGWVWRPYSDAYHYEGAEGSYAYVYYPPVGWTWLVAPWASGWWPWPYYGFSGYWGPRGFHWYGPGWRGYGWRGHGWPGHGWSGGWSGHGWGGSHRATPAPPRSAPAPRRR
jgi:hypothetical protein